MHIIIRKGCFIFCPKSDKMKMINPWKECISWKKVKGDYGFLDFCVWWFQGLCCQTAKAGQKQLSIRLLQVGNKLRKVIIVWLTIPTRQTVMWWWNLRRHWVLRWNVLLRPGDRRWMMVTNIHFPWISIRLFHWRKEILPIRFICFMKWVVVMRWRWHWK